MSAAALFFLPLLVLRWYNAPASHDWEVIRYSKVVEELVMDSINEKNAEMAITMNLLYRRSKP